MYYFLLLINNLTGGQKDIIDDYRKSKDVGIESQGTLYIIINKNKDYLLAKHRYLCYYVVYALQFKEDI